MRDIKQKDLNLHSQVDSPGNPQVASHVRGTRFRDMVTQHMAVELVISAIHEQIRAFAALVMVAAWNIATLVTQPDVVIAVVLGTSEPARDAIFRFVRCETTQLGKSWYLVSYFQQQVCFKTTTYASGAFWQLCLCSSPAPARGMR